LHRIITWIIFLSLFGVNDEARAKGGAFILRMHLNLCCKHGNILNIVLGFHFSMGAAASTTHKVASPLFGVPALLNVV
jgi:hypothetical protein